MNKVNLTNIQQKLKLNENIIKKISTTTTDDSFELTDKDNSHIDMLVKEMARIMDFDEMVTNLLKSKLYGSAYNFVDFSMNEAKKIYRVNIGLYNWKTGLVDETGLHPNLFIDVFTNLTAQQIQKHPENEKHYKDMYLKLLKHIEKNKYNE